MDLHNYPAAIAQVQCKLLIANQEIEKISQALSGICNQFELQVAFDSKLKNEQQRKAKKAEFIRTSGDYEQLSRQLADKTYNRDILLIQLEQFKNEFAVDGDARPKTLQALGL
ncbi:MAG: hypothetical protein RM338_12470 [Nostoc sp. DedQUE12a]|nr:hypothetical protein [Nostoc sp. DedQUE12a]